VFVHGGGWVVGGIASHDDQARRLCRDLGAVVVSVDYRLAPEHPFPAAVDDVSAVFDAVAAEATRLGGDPARLAVAGDSAGGNLAAVLALHARAHDVPLAAQLLVYPATDLGTAWPSMTENADGLFLTRDDAVWFTRRYLGGDRSLATDPRVSPARAATLAGLAPAVVVTAGYDPIRDDGDAYAEALRAAGVCVVHRRFDALTHGFFGMTGISAACEDAVAWTVEAFGTLLRA
jgi:acetyl esterase